MKYNSMCFGFSFLNLMAIASTALAWALYWSRRSDGTAAEIGDAPASKVSKSPGKVTGLFHFLNL
jgi:hypothetical protein